MLEQIDPLPYAERHVPADHGNRQVRLGQRGTDVGRHVIRAFESVPLARVVLRDKPFEKVPGPDAPG
jgi:hypothetical protein